MTFSTSDETRYPYIYTPLPLPKDQPTKQPKRAVSHLHSRCHFDVVDACASLYLAVPQVQGFNAPAAVPEVGDDVSGSLPSGEVCNPSACDVDATGPDVKVETGDKPSMTAKLAPTAVDAVAVGEGKMEGADEPVPWSSVDASPPTGSGNISMPSEGGSTNLEFLYEV